MAKKEKNDKQRLMVVNFSVAEPPTFYESNYNEWVKAGKDDKYFDNLLLYSNLSSTHKSILSSKIYQIINGEIIFDTKKDELNINQNFIEKLAGDLEIFGAYAIEVILSRNKKMVAEINHIPLQYLRYAKTSGLKSPGMFFHKNWKKAKVSKPTFIPFFDINSKEPRQILLIKKYWAGSEYNIIPSYYGGFNYIKTDYEISKFNLNTIEKGLTPSIIISFNDGKPNPEQADAINELIKEKFSGSEGEKLLLLFNDNKDKAADIKILDGSDTADMYSNLTKETSQQILTAHQLTSPALAGIRVPGQLGNSTELLQANELFQKNVIIPDRNLIINGLNLILKINKNRIEINSQQSLISSFSETFIEKITSVNERRKMLGLTELNEKEINNLKNNTNE